MWSIPTLVLTNRIGRALSVVGMVMLALVFYTFVVAHFARQGQAVKVRNHTIREIQRVQGKETVRVVKEIRRVQVRSQADIRELAKREARINQLIEESNRASAVNDAIACLPADSVQRIADVR